MPKGHKAKGSYVGAIGSYTTNGVFSLPSAQVLTSNNAWVNVITSGLIAYVDAGMAISYPGSGSTWTDLSGTGNSATLYNSPGYSSSNSGYLTFNGTNQYAQFPAGMANFTSGITVCALVNFGSATNWERIIDFGSGSPSNNILLARAGTTNTLHAEVLNGTSNTFTHEVANTVQNGSWAFYSWTYDNSTSTLGINGTYYTQSSVSSIANVSRSNNYIARSNWSGDSYFESGMQTVLVYNRALSQAETTANFNTLRSRFGL